MAGEKYGDKAIANLLSYYETNLPTYLRAVETAQSLCASSLADPVDYIPAYVPDDTRSPLFQVFTLSGESLDPRNQLYLYDCVINVGYSSDADIEAGQLFMRRYMTALIDTLVADRTLGGNVVEAVETEQNYAAEKSGGQTRYAISLGVQVTTFQ